MASLSAYETLLLDYQPRPIRTKSAYKRALRQVEGLMAEPQLGRAESEMVELLSTLIEQYESVEHPTPASGPSEVLEHLIEAGGLTRAQLARKTGIPRSTITNILAGRRGVSKANAAKLAKYFHVAVGLFLESD